MQIESEISIARPPAEVFDYIAHAEYLPEYVADFSSVDQVSGAGDILNIVSISGLRPDPSLAVGATVTASGSKLGQLLDLSRVGGQARHVPPDLPHPLLTRSCHLR